MSKADFFGDHDVFVEYDFEDVMFRWDAKERKIYKKFKDENSETETRHDNRLFNEAISYGDVISRDRYFRDPINDD